MSEKLTPMMQQWFDIKKDHPDKILFFRMGDFYEMFFEDAEKSSKMLQIALTKRAGAPMCGIPHHAFNSYISKMVSSGEKIAIVEQTEDPKTAAGKVVGRAVSQILTPGTLTLPDTVDYKSNNFLCSFMFYDENSGAFSEKTQNVFPGIDTEPMKKKLVFAAIDISTGETELNIFQTGYPAIEIETFLTKYNPKEIVVPEKLKSRAVKLLDGKNFRSMINTLPDYIFDTDYASEKLLSAYGLVNFKPFGLDTQRDLLSPLYAVIHYSRETQQHSAPHVKIPQIIHNNSYMQLDSMTIVNLELTRNNYDGTVSHTLLQAMDETLTPMGGRFLKTSLHKPLCNLKEIQNRQSIVEALIAEHEGLQNIRERLKSVYDLERLAGRLALSKILPKELITLKNSLKSFENLIKEVKTLKIKGFDARDEELNQAASLGNLIETVLVSEPSNNLSDGGYIRAETSQELKECFNIRNHGKEMLIELTQKEKEKTGINLLKIKYNHNAGYFFDVTKTWISSVPDYFIKKQTLTNSSRYTTEELIVLQDKILNANEKAVEIEKKAYNELLRKLQEKIRVLQKIASFAAQCDLLASFAWSALTRHFVKPEIHPGYHLLVTNGRHPVIEQNDDLRFIPNSVEMREHESFIHIITGPNMSGKSTYLRQNALIVLMAHTGSFVPADAASIPLCDRIFTRIGASDNLSRGESTFLVEMNETANILTNATSKSMVIMDEIGRGTSTYDGLSLAWAILEYLHESQKMQCKTLFATHYHELTQLEAQFKGIENFHFTAKEERGTLTFLKKISSGAADKSYGIHVAELAGLPAPILKRARSIEENLELHTGLSPEDLSKTTGTDVSSNSSFSQGDGLSALLLNTLEEIKSFNTNEKTPLEAMLFIEKQKKILKDAN